MKVSARESVLMVLALSAALLGGSFLLLRQRYGAWQQVRAAQEMQRQDIAHYRDLISQENDWIARYDGLKGWLPQFPADKDMLTYWLSEMDAAASKNNLTIGRSEARPEQRSGDIHELPIECQNWSGSLDALVQFLFDLQAEGAMLDIRQLFVKPMDPSSLRGSFTLYCAYIREAEVD